MSFGQSLTSLRLGPIPELAIKTGEALGAPVEFGLTISARATMRLNASRVYACAPSRIFAGITPHRRPAISELGEAAMGKARCMAQPGSGTKAFG